MSTETAPQRSEQLLNEAVQRFRFEPFDANSEDVEDYLERFEIQLDVVGLATAADPTQDMDDRKKTKRRTLLLANVGKETHAKLRRFPTGGSLTNRLLMPLSASITSLSKRFCQCMWGILQA